MADPNNVYDRLLTNQQARVQLVQDTVRELQTNPAYQPYFAGYTPESVAAFIAQYAERKASYTFDGPNRARYFEAGSTEVVERAHARLWDIQQKKLFDLQCRWRAGLWQHPAIQVVEQFEYWGRHPDRCPFLPPITPDELALYLDYLAQPDCPEGDWSRRALTHQWQDYFHLRSEYYADELPLLPADSHVFTQDNDEDDEDEDEDDEDEDDEDEDDWDDDDDEGAAYPAWYRHYDQQQGTGHLRHLPNVRGMRQQHYVDLSWRDTWQRERLAAATAPVAAAPPAEAAPANSPPPAEQPPKPPYVPDQRPWLSMEDADSFQLLMERFDPTPGLLELQRAQKDGIEARDSREAEEALFAISNLLDSNLIVPIEEPAADWRPALRRAELLLRRQQLLRALPLAYEEYCQRQELGLTQTAPALGSSFDDETEEPALCQRVREQVLRGRELAGEPQDFDY